MVEFILVTGTGTDVGKTVLTTLLIRRLRTSGLKVLAFKPLCSGGRDDARRIHRASAGVPLEVINPWHFRPPLAPAIAARRAGRPVSLAEIVGHLRYHASQVDLALVEGAGGVLSPLAEDGDVPELVSLLQARPVLVAVNRLGVIHDTRSALACFPRKLAERIPVVLMAPALRDASSRDNPGYLRDLLGPERVFQIGRLDQDPSSCAIPSAIARELDRLAASLRGSRPVRPGRIVARS